MTGIIKWGLLGAGGIAHKFAADFNSKVTNGTITSVSARDIEKASAFAQKYNIPKAFGSYESMLKTGDIDVVYLATTHNFHFEQVKLCLEHGKHVLCEKPITVNARELEVLMGIARQKKLFLMEAMWTRFLPTIVEAQKWVQQNRIGKIELIQANFGMKFPYNPQGRLFNMSLAGGALLDIGIYVLTIADIFAQSEVENMQVLGKIGETSIDEHVAIQIEFKNGVKAQLYTSATCKLRNHAMIYGSDGNIDIHDFWMTKKATLVSGNATLEYVDNTLEMGYNHEAEMVNQCLLKGLKECPQMPMETSMRLLKIMDKIRAELGLEYPFELKDI